MSLEVPIISIIIGEGGSGGAIALASANKVLMLENAIYSVISPEGCASILWRDPNKSLEAAKAMKLTANELLKMGIIDEIIKEPIGGAHRNKEEITSSVRKAIDNYLVNFTNFSRTEIYNQRKEKFLNIGKSKSFSTFSGETVEIFKKSNLSSLVKKIFSSKKNKIIIGVVFLLIAGYIFY
tara:strand:- start:438 stop:980 length:543 start_codon:yes stop_codon:yes gene_type:complete